MKKRAFLICIVSLLVAMSAPIFVACSPKDDGEGGGPDIEPTCFIVEFDSLGGTSVAEQQIEEGGFAVKPTDPTKIDCVFEGWYDLNGSENGEWGDKWSFELYPVNSNLTLYAKWSETPKTYTVTFYDGNVVYDSQENLSAGEIVIEPTEPTAVDKTFIGWFLSSDGGVTLGDRYDFSDPVSADLDLYAKWENKLFINFDYNGATHANQTEKIEVANGVSYRLPRPMKSESTFVGWFDDEGTKYELTGTFSGTESIALTARWTEGTSGLVYEKNDRFAKVVGATASLTEITVPESYEGLYVTEISAHAFVDVTGLERITLCEGITDIGEGAFYSQSAPLTSLSEIVLPSSLKVIGIDAFNGLIGLKSIRLNEGLETISNRAFKSSGLVSVTIPSTVTKIYDGAFNESPDLRTVVFTRDKNASGGITVPNGASRAILRQNKSGLVVFVPANSMTEYSEAWGTQYQWQMTGKTAIVSDEFLNSDSIVRDGVLYAYFGTESEYVTENITEIYCGAFEDNTNIESVVLSDGIVAVGASAFMGCTDLTSVTSLSENMPTIKSYSKENQTYTNVFNADNSVIMHVSGSCYNQFRQSAGYNASSKEKITYNVTLEDGDSHTSLNVGRYEVIEFPAAERILGKKHTGYTSNGVSFDPATKITADAEIVYVWENCEVYTVTFVTNVDETIDTQHLNDGEKATKPQNPTPTVGAFEGWFLSDDNGATLSDEYDFETAVTADLTLYAKYSEVDTKSVITLDYNGATHDIGVAEISKAVGETFELPRPHRNDATFLGWFDSADKKHEMSGTVQYVDDYTLTAKWQLASDGLEYVLSNLQTNYAVKAGSCTDLDVVIPEWHNGFVVDIIGNSAFENTSITSVVLPDTIKTINQKAFFGTPLKEVVIPSAVTMIGNGAFNRCADLKLVTILRSATVDGSITALGNNAVFRLTSPGIVVFVPTDSISEYSSNANWKSQQNRWGTGATWSFEDAERLFTSDDVEGGFIIRGTTLYGYIGDDENITVPASVTEIADGAFYGSAASSIVLHDGITSIGAMAFAKAENITELVMPENLASIGARAFDGCSGLTKVTFTSVSVPTITAVQLWSGTADNVIKVTDIFEENGDGLAVIVPAEAVDAYKATFTAANITAGE